MIRLLEGVRVIEFGSLLNVNMLGSNLANFGADVIKVESPGRGDYTRDMIGQIAPGVSPAHVQLNANKRSVNADMKSEGGREIFWRLLDTADVFITGTIADTCDRLGIGFDRQRERRPGIVFCQVTGFGATGPYAHIPTHGYSMNALAADWPMSMGDDGLMHLDPPGAPIPRKCPDAPSAGGVWGAYYVAAGLVRSRTTGEGVYIDLSATDAVIASSANADAYVLNESRITDWTTMPVIDRVTAELRGAKLQHYLTKDGNVVIFGSIEPHFWRNFCAAVGRPDLASTDDTANVVDFGRGRGDDDELRREIQRIMLTRTQDEWIALARAHDFALSPSPRSPLDVPDDPQIRTRDLYVRGEHPLAGPFTYVGVPGVIEDQRFEVARPAPSAGEHTDEVLAELGYATDEVAELRARHIV